ncbi:hypothetical protein GCM10009815_28770 [Nocardioides marmoribigeumensis]
MQVQRTTRDGVTGGPREPSAATGRAARALAGLDEPERPAGWAAAEQGDGRHQQEEREGAERPDQDERGDRQREPHDPT